LKGHSEKSSECPFFWSNRPCLMICPSIQADNSLRNKKNSHQIEHTSTVNFFAHPGSQHKNQEMWNKDHANSLVYNSFWNETEYSTSAKVPEFDRKHMSTNEVPTYRTRFFNHLKSIKTT